MTKEYLRFLRPGRRGLKALKNKMKIRLQKFLAERGVGSRRKVEEMIHARIIKVNGKPAELGIKVDENDRIEIDGKVVETGGEKKIYIMFNKPRGVLSTCQKSKELGEMVLDYVKTAERIYPVGRLDKDSEGLMILTNDGELALKLTHPRYEHEKEYLVKFQILDPKSETNPKSKIQNLKKIMDNLARGVDIGGYITRKSTARLLTKNSFLITLKEGKKRQIRRMCEAVGLGVLSLKRVRMGGLCLDENLKDGEWRELTAEETKKLNKVGQSFKSFKGYKGMSHEA